MLQAPRLRDDLFDEFLQMPLDRRRALDSERKRRRNEPDEHETLRVTLVEAGAIE